MLEIGPRAKEDADELWKWLLHESTLFHARTTIFIAAQALLLAGFAATLKADGPHPIEVGITLVGLVMAVLWITAMWRQKVGTIDAIKSVLREFGHSQEVGNFFRGYSRIAEDRSRSLLPGLDALIGYWVPSIFIAAWIGLLLYLFCHN